MTQDSTYIWKQPGWPAFHYDPGAVGAALASARRAQGTVEGKLAALGFEQRLELAAEAWSQEAVATAAIEGERLDLAAVRSSVARRLGVGKQDGPNAPRNVEGLLDIMDDAVTRCADEMTDERLHAWQAALFPTGYSGMTKVLTGGYREHAEPMQIVSGRAGREQVHYEAPPSARVPEEMGQLLRWFNASTEPDTLVRTALTHLWFETIHPFEDGNGRIARAIADLALARSEQSDQRFYSMSAQIRIERSGYFHILEWSQKGTLDITSWLRWFLDCLGHAIESAQSALNGVVHRTRFCDAIQDFALNERQRSMLNRLLDGFTGKLTTTKWAALAKCSQDTALRDILPLVERGILARGEGGGRSTSYELAAQAAF